MFYAYFDIMRRQNTVYYQRQLSTIIENWSQPLCLDCDTSQLFPGWYETSVCLL